jgi:zinc and cadmium transporter
MSAISLVGASALALRERTLQRVIRQLVAFAAGALLGGAFLHMLPEAAESLGGTAFSLAVLGFTVFFGLEQLVHWHRCRRPRAEGARPFALLILIGDALHNFVGGVAFASALRLDPWLGLTTWVAEAAHEVPQELGDFGVLLHGGFARARALAWNLAASATFVLGAVVTWLLPVGFDLAALLAFAAGNFIYLGASDLVPEVAARGGPGETAAHFAWFCAGLGLLWGLRFAIGP